MTPPITSVSFSIRLPVAVYEKIRSQLERFPEKSRNKIITELLVSSLAEFDKNHPPRILEDLTDFIPY